MEKNIEKPENWKIQSTNFTMLCEKNETRFLLRMSKITNRKNGKNSIKWIFVKCKTAFEVYHVRHTDTLLPNLIVLSGTFPIANRPYPPYSLHYLKIIFPF